MASPSSSPAPIPPLIPTDYAAFVLDVLARNTSQPLDQRLIRQCLSLASSFLITDATMNTDSGVSSWTVGFNRLIDVIVALHALNELEIETMDAASKACSECWSVSGSWKGFDNCKDGVRAVAGKLKKLLDENGLTYRGQSIYTP